MKINEITNTFKVVRSTPQEVQVQSPTTNTTITTTPAAFSQNPQDPKSMMLNLGNTMQSPGTSGQAPAAQEQGQVPGQVPGMQGQAPAAQEQGQAPAAQEQGQAPAAQGQATQGQAPGTTGQQLPQVGAEVELPDNFGSTVQSETFNDGDLVDSKKNKDVSGDKSNDYINDITNDDETYKSGRSQRNFSQHAPVKESAELIAMLTIAGLR
jgi:hypothetical protein